MYAQYEKTTLHTDTLKIYKNMVFLLCYYYKTRITVKNTVCSRLHNLLTFNYAHLRSLFLSCNWRSEATIRRLDVGMQPPVIPVAIHEFVWYD